MKNPLRVIDCKEPGCKEIVKDAPRTIDYLCEECDAHFKELQRLLTELEIPFEIDTPELSGDLIIIPRPFLNLSIRKALRFAAAADMIIWFMRLMEKKRSHP